MKKTLITMVVTLIGTVAAMATTPREAYDTFCGLGGVKQVTQQQLAFTKTTALDNAEIAYVESADPKYLSGVKTLAGNIGIQNLLLGGCNPQSIVAIYSIQNTMGRNDVVALVSTPIMSAAIFGTCDDATLKLLATASLEVEGQTVKVEVENSPQSKVFFIDIDDD